MSCAQTCREADTRSESWVDEPQDDPTKRVSDRQAAVMYLQAAALTDDAEARNRCCDGAGWISCSAGRKHLGCVGPAKIRQGAREGATHESSWLGRIHPVVRERSPAPAPA